MNSFDVLIVGAGHGGAQAATALRQANFGGSIAVLGDEADPPYERPPLSKEYLLREKSFERLLIRRADYWEQKGIDLRLNQQVTEIDASSRTVVSKDGARIQYGKMIWATGGRPRRLSCAGHDLAGVHVVRTRLDVDKLFGELERVERVVVVGGGYIGLEVAAILRKLGKHVSVLEAQDRVLARVAGEPLSRFFEAEHRARGVDIRLEAQVEAIVGDRERVSGVRLVGGEILPAELVVVGVGIVPTVEPLLAAGAEGGNGVRVDEHCQTSLPDVYAIGDCAEHRNRWAQGDWIRLESVQNANDQATVAAMAIGGRPEPYQAVPWFWSNQYDLRLQTVGLSRGYDDLVVRGNPDTRSFSVIYLRDSEVIALDCVNSVRDFSQGRSLVANRATPAKAALADLNSPLSSLR